MARCSRFVSGRDLLGSVDLPKRVLDSLLCLLILVLGSLFALVPQSVAATPNDGTGVLSSALDIYGYDESGGLECRNLESVNTTAWTSKTLLVGRFTPVDVPLPRCVVGYDAASLLRVSCAGVATKTPVAAADDIALSLRGSSASEALGTRNGSQRASPTKDRS